MMQAAAQLEVYRRMGTIKLEGGPNFARKFRPVYPLKQRIFHTRYPQF